MDDNDNDDDDDAELDMMEGGAVDVDACSRGLVMGLVTRSDLGGSDERR